MRRGRPSRPGFTIPEILVVVVLFSVLSFSLLLNVRTSSRRLKSEGLARAVVAELRAARAVAAQDQTDVLVAFPGTPGGGVCRSFRLYRGEDGFRPARTLNFDQQYDSFLFAGTWPTTTPWTLEPSLEPARLADLGNINAIIFHPDGSMETNLPRLEGSALLAVDDALEWTPSEGLLGSLRASANPNTVVITPSGIIRLEKGLLGLSEPLPQTEIRPTLLALAPLPEEADSTPQIQKVEFLPRSAAGGASAGIGKTYIEIHPVSEDGAVKEYGLATITAEATASEGGPLMMEVVVTASTGSPGTLASEGPVRMEYREGRWVGTVGWRPPPEADPNVRYEFDVTVTSPQGLTARASSDASVLPTLRTLSDFRLAIESSDEVIHLANLEGGELVRITPPGAAESLPVWSGDGTKLYVVSRTGGNHSFVVYNADGTGRKVVSHFPPDASDFSIDPAGIYLKYMHGMTSTEYTILGDKGPKKESVDTFAMSALHVSNGHAVLVADGVVAEGGWLPNLRGVFQYSVAVIGEMEGPAFDEEGLPIEDETAIYSTISSNPVYNTLVGLGPEVRGYAAEHPTNVTNASFNPYDPNYYVLWQPGAMDSPSKVSLFRYHAEDGSWKPTLNLAEGLRVLEPPAWSANGQWLAFLVARGETATELQVQRVRLPEEGAPMETLATADVARAVNFPHGVSSPRPTPDGANVLYIDRRDPGTGAKLMQMSTTDESNPVQIGKDLPGVVNFAITQ